MRCGICTGSPHWDHLGWFVGKVICGFGGFLCLRGDEVKDNYFSILSLIEVWWCLAEVFCRNSEFSDVNVMRQTVDASPFVSLLFILCQTWRQTLSCESNWLRWAPYIIQLLLTGTSNMHPHAVTTSAASVHTYGQSPWSTGSSLRWRNVWVQRQIWCKSEEQTVLHPSPRSSVWTFMCDWLIDGFQFAVQRFSVNTEVIFTLTAEESEIVFLCQSLNTFWIFYFDHWKLALGMKAAHSVALKNLKNLKVGHFGPEWNISTAIWSITVTVHPFIRVSFRINYYYCFTDLLTSF